MFRCQSYGLWIIVVMLFESNELWHAMNYLIGEHFGNYNGAFNVALNAPLKMLNLENSWVKSSWPWGEILWGEFILILYMMLGVSSVKIIKKVK